MVVVVAPVVGVLVVWSAGLVAVADVWAFTAVVAAGVTPIDARFGSARLVVVLVDVSLRSASKLFLVMKFDSVICVGIGLWIAFKFCKTLLAPICPP